MVDIKPGPLVLQALAGRQPNAGNGTQYTIGDYGSSFLQSALWGAAELLGADVPNDVTLWREQNPLGSFVSEFAAPTGYLGAALKIGRLGKFGKVVDTLGAGKHPTLRRAFQEGVRLAPFELGRIGLTGLTGGDVGEVATDALVNTLGASAVGGVVGTLEAAGARAAKPWTLPTKNFRAPIQMQGRDLLEQVRSGKLNPDLMAQAQKQLKEWSLRVRLDADTDVTTKTFFKAEPLFGGKRQELNRLFRFGSKDGKGGQNKRVKKLAAVADRGFANAAELEDVIKRAGFQEGWVFNGQNFRHVSFPSTGAARNFRAGVLRNMKAVGNNIWLNQEKDGLYAIAKRLQGSGRDRFDRRAGMRVPNAAADDQWVIFKTDNPGFYDPTLQRFKSRMDNSNAWLRKLDDPKELALQGQSMFYSLGKKLSDDLPLSVFQADKTRGAAKLADDFGASLAKFYDLGEMGYGVDMAKAFARELLAPAMFQFGHNPRAKWLYTVAKGIFRAADETAARLLVGERQLKGTNLWGQVAKGVMPEGGLDKLVDTLSDEDTYKFWQILNRGLSLDEALALDGISENLATFLRKNSEVEDAILKEIQTLQKLSGVEEIKPRKGHWMMTKTWKGDFRVPVMDGQKIVAVGSGTSRKEALDDAEELVKAAAEQGANWRSVGEAIQRQNAIDDYKLMKTFSTDKRDLAMLASIREGQAAIPKKSPGFLKERTFIEGSPSGVAGALTHRAPMTKQQIKEVLSSHLQQQHKYAANLSVQQLLKDEFAKLLSEDPGLARQLQGRLNDMLGIQGQFSRMQNQWADKVLSPVLGSNSATKLVRGFNNFMFHTQFGFGNLAFAGMTLMTFAQTVVPELAFLATGAPSKLSRYYSHFMKADSAGNPTGEFGMLDMWKVVKGGFRNLSKADDEFRGMADRALHDGVFDPRLVEEFIGPTAKVKLSMKEVLADPSKGIVEVMKQVSSWLPEQTERMSRAHSFSTGYTYGKDILGLQGDRLYNFAREFTGKTMYLYSTADRPRAMTGPLGSAFGLFKNWQMHYLFTMMDYFDEGLTRNNWKPLLWSFTGSGSVGGIAATGPLYFVANNMSEWLADEPLMEAMYSAFGGRDEGQPNISDALFMGIPGFLPTIAGLPGVSFAQQTSLPFGDPTRDISQLMSFVYWDRMKAFGQLVGTAFDRAEATGQNPVTDPQVLGQMMRAFAPKTIYRLQQTLGSNVEGALASSSTGYPQVTGLDPMEKVLYSLGFNPHKVELTYRSNETLWNDQKAMKELTSAMGRAYAGALDNRDTKTMKAIMLQSMAKGVDWDAVRRSARAYSHKLNEGMLERNFSAVQVQAYNRLGLTGS